MHCNLGRDHPEKKEIPSQAISPFSGTDICLSGGHRPANGPDGENRLLAPPPTLQVSAQILNPYLRLPHSPNPTPPPKLLLLTCHPDQMSHRQPLPPLLLLPFPPCVIFTRNLRHPFHSIPSCICHLYFSFPAVSLPSQPLRKKSKVPHFFTSLLMNSKMASKERQ